MTPRELSWLVPGRCPKYPTMIAGPADAGKTTFMAAIAGAIAGDYKCFGKSLGVQQTTLWFTCEEDPASMTMPKLLAAGADANRIVFPMHDAEGDILYPV